MNSNLIIDIGMSEGNDTAFYLAKGFQVLGVEADPITFAHLERRFEPELADGRLTIIHAAASDRSGETVEFWRNDTHQGLSSLSRHGQASEGGCQTCYQVPTLAWPELIGSAETPHYLKIDIEGGEAPFLRSIGATSKKPAFISVEAHSFEPPQLLFDLGYRRFKLVNQTIIQGFPVPYPALEGLHVPNPDWSHASGLFGCELPGEWVDFDGFRKLYEAMALLRTHRTAQHSWFDCHAAF